MLSQADLLHLAEAFATRIPRSPDYALDWNAAWRAIASARLRVDDIASAQRAMRNVDEPCLQAQLRIEAGRWVGKHPASADGRDVLRDTVARASAFEPWWSRRDVTDLVPPRPAVSSQELTRSGIGTRLIRWATAFAVSWITGSTISR